MGALPRVCQPLDFANMCAKTVTASAFGWNGDGFTEQCPWLKGFVFVRLRLARPGVVIVARTRESIYVSTLLLLWLENNAYAWGKEQWSAQCGSASFDR